jgi:DNA helicase-2/ATP-dependent DNA helicase PcrA
MPITREQIQAAQNIQHAAAHDTSPQVRLLAGPGTGKSSTIEERVSWLLASQFQPFEIFVVSFTRASARDLRGRIIRYCFESRNQDASSVSVTTLHSLALRSLRMAGLLAYPVDPLVLDDWELENIHDPEYSSSTGFRAGTIGVGSTPARAKEIRQDYEAFCGTGRWQPPGYIYPPIPITQIERQQYSQFHRLRTQLYSYVLPGEIVRQCVENINAGVLNLAALLRIRHLIVDEYQDLNPSDISFVDALIRSGVTVFVAGDDDQSLYSFRYAFPQGIQLFNERHPHTSTHVLTDCFRSTPNILTPATNLIQTFADPTRVPKPITSLFTNSQPPVPGVVHRWKFLSGIAEARAIAESCRDLISAGITPRQIMILLCNTRATLRIITQELTLLGISYQSPRDESFFDTREGRFIFSIIRIICDSEDYISHRLLIGLTPGVGPVTCNSIAYKAITNMMNYRNLFYQPIPDGIFTRREISAIESARHICSIITDWSPNDTLESHIVEIDNLLDPILGPEVMSQFHTEISSLPNGSNIQETRDYLWADNDEQKANILQNIFIRLGLQVPNEGFLPQQLRIMTMHGSKGLGSNIVFIPMLEEQIIPGPHRQPYPGLVLEAARMLYVAITRARAACILSFAENRIMYGTFTNQRPSRFIPSLQGQFEDRISGLTPDEINEIVHSCENL